jgi:hypothetical protein
VCGRRTAVTFDPLARDEQGGHTNRVHATLQDSIDAAGRHGQGARGYAVKPPSMVRLAPVT